MPTSSVAGIASTLEQEAANAIVISPPDMSEINNTIEEKEEAAAVGVDVGDPLHAPCPLPTRNFVFVVIGCILSILLSTLNTTMVVTALPVIAHEFNALADAFWVGAAFMLANTAVQPLYGRCSDVFGRRNTILFALSCFTLASLGCALSTSMVMLIGFRAMMGLGAGGINTLVYLILADVVAPFNRGKYQGMVSAVYALTSALGPLLGGIFTDQFSWRWCFYLSVPVGGLSAVTLCFALRLPPVTGSMRQKLGKIDFVGALLIPLATVACLLPTSWGGHRYDWYSPAVITLYALCLLLVGLTVWWEGWRAAYPLTPGRLFRRRSCCAAFVCSFFFGWPQLGILYYLPLFFQFLRGESATSAGLRLLPMLVTGSLIAALAGVATSYLPGWSYRVLVSTGLMLTSVGCGLLLLFRATSQPAIEILVMILIGIGTGLGMHLVMLVAQFSADRSDIAAATTLTSFFRNIGASFGIAGTGIVFNNVFIVEQRRLLPDVDIHFEPDGQLTHLAPEQLSLAMQALQKAFHMAFLSNVPPLVIAFLAALCFKVTYDAREMRLQAKLKQAAASEKRANTSTTQRS